MSNYIPPNFSNLSFKFSSSGGYSPPNFSNLVYKFGNRPSYTSTAQLNAYIQVSQLYQDSTYTYVKECRTIVVGYTDAGIQTIKLPCLYGGIRDLGGYIIGIPHYKDLEAVIKGLPSSVLVDLLAYIRPFTRDSVDLVPYIVGNVHTYDDLSAYFRYMYRSNKDLGSKLFVLHGHEVIRDLNTTLYAISPVNLNAQLNIIEIRNILATINGEWWHGYSDLNADFYRVYFRNNKDLLLNIHVWDTKDLLGYIRSFHFEDLNAYLNAGFFAVSKDLEVYLNSVNPIDIYGYIHGWDTKDLKAYITYGYGPNDLRAFITTIDPKDLKAYIVGYKGYQVIKDLQVYISSFYEKILQAHINVVEARTLKAYINILGASIDLEAYIYPKTITIKRIMMVSLLDHKDLLATINYNCFKSSYSDLKANLYLLHKNDLKAYIIGWFGNFADNVKDLKAYINAGDVLCTDTITLNFSSTTYQHELYTLSGGARKAYKNVDYYYVGGGAAFKNLKAYVRGELYNKDLSALIKPEPIANYTPLPKWIDPKNREVVINLRRFEPRWRRFIDLMFFTNSKDDYHYFYVSATDEVYKIDKDRTWIINVIGYSNNPNSIIDRRGVRRKFLFNLSKYKTVDEALRSLIDRVTELSYSDLKGVINPTYDRCKNLTCYIKPNIKYFWTSMLKAAIIGKRSSSKDLSASISVS